MLEVTKTVVIDIRKIKMNKYTLLIIKPPYWK